MRPVQQEFDAPCWPSLFSLSPHIKESVMDKFLANLKIQAEENPIAALGVAAALLHGASKLLNANAWSKEVNRRVKASR